MTDIDYGCKVCLHFNNRLDFSNNMVVIERGKNQTRCSIFNEVLNNDSIGCETHSTSIFDLTNSYRILEK
jgi:hypothetical protein